MALLEGLEISEILLSKCKSIIDFRIDANTYKKDYLKSDELIRGSNPKSISTLSKSVQNFGAYSLCNFINFTEQGIPFLMTENIKHNFIDWKIRKCVDEESHKRLYKSHCQKNQVLVTMAGSLGRVAVYNRSEVCSSNQAIAKITLENKVNPYIISTFLNSKHGQNQINRFKTITAQPNINMAMIQELLIPEFGNEFALAIEQLVTKSEATRDNSFVKYSNAENVLLQVLGLKDFHPSPNPINVKSFSTSFGSSGRLDAEYYQVKYEQVVERIKSTNYDRLANLVKIKKSIEPGSKNYTDKGLPFVRVSDYDKFGLSTPDKYLTGEFCKENAGQIKKLKPKKETILFSKDGSVGTAYMLRKDASFITSGAILHLSVKDKTKIIPEYITLALNSKLVQMQAERDSGGSIILHWRVSEIENVVVPVIDFDRQQEIADMVEKSFHLKKQSEHLLEVAKTAVEMAIEQGEGPAMSYINERANGYAC